MHSGQMVEWVETVTGIQGFAGSNPRIGKSLFCSIVRLIISTIQVYKFAFSPDTLHNVIGSSTFFFASLVAHTGRRLLDWSVWLNDLERNLYIPKNQGVLRRPRGRAVRVR